MAQGKLKVNAKKKSGGSQRRQSAVSKRSKKGARTFNTKRSHKVGLAKEQAAVSRSINVKNEALIASKALGNRSTIFLGDLKAAGQAELKKQQQTRRKEVDKNTKKKYIERAKSQLEKLGR